MQATPQPSNKKFFSPLSKNFPTTDLFLNEETHGDVAYMHLDNVQSFPYQGQQNEAAVYETDFTQNSSSSPSSYSSNNKEIQNDFLGNQNIYKISKESVSLKAKLEILEKKEKLLTKMISLYKEGTEHHNSYLTELDTVAQNQLSILSKMSSDIEEF